MQGTAYGSRSRSTVASMAPRAVLGIVGETAAPQIVLHEADVRLRRALATLETT